MKIEFEKLHGLGNDFIVIDGREKKLPNYNELAKRVCDRHFGIGADGMMIVEESDVAEVKMLFFNADGTQAPMCGNGIRCFSKFVYDNKIVDKLKFKVDTLAGIMKPELYLNDGEVESVRVNLGKPDLKASNVPVITDEERYIGQKLDVDGVEYDISAITMGSVHAVVYMEDLKNLDIDKVGPAIETHPIFPKKINVNFCEIVDENNFDVLTWERGVGQTLACGTGAATSCIIASKLYNTDNKVKVHLLGGDVMIEQIEGEVFMTGAAEMICKGLYNFK